MGKASHRWKSMEGGQMQAEKSICKISNIMEQGQNHIFYYLPLHSPTLPISFPSIHPDTRDECSKRAEKTQKCEHFHVPKVKFITWVLTILTYRTDNCRRDGCRWRGDRNPKCIRWKMQKNFVWYNVLSGDVFFGIRSASEMLVRHTKLRNV